MNTMFCNVTGMQNNEGKTQIKNALNKIKGVNEVGINLPQGTIEIQYNDPATIHELRNCIEHSGFEILY